VSATPLLLHLPFTVGPRGVAHALPRRPPASPTARPRSGPRCADDPASRPLERGTDSAEGGHLGGLANQGVTQKLDQVFSCTECGSATENSGPRRQ
jgi:hypothetical protein